MDEVASIDSGVEDRQRKGRGVEFLLLWHSGCCAFETVRSQRHLIQARDSEATPIAVTRSPVSNAFWSPGYSVTEVSVSH